MSYIYLASPYTHPDPEVRAFRFRAAAEYAASLVTSRIAVFSPIVHGHALSQIAPLPLDHDLWMDQCLPMLQAAHSLCVLAIDGWVTSRGVARELVEARRLRLPIEIKPRPVLVPAGG